MREPYIGNLRGIFQSDAYDAHFTGPTARLPRGGVHKDHKLAAADVFGKFRRQLVPAQNGHFRQPSFQFISGAPRQTVIAAKRVSVGHDQHAGRRR